MYVAPLAQSFRPALFPLLLKMAMVDSVATFKARVLDLGLGDYWPKFEEKTLHDVRGVRLQLQLPAGESG